MLENEKGSIMCNGARGTLRANVVRGLCVCAVWIWDWQEHCGLPRPLVLVLETWIVFVCI